MTYLNEGDFVLIPNPGYPTYKSAATIAGGKCMEYNLTKENNWLPDFKEIENNLYVKRVKIMFVNYPHMPTGQLPTTEVFEQLITFAKKYNILIVHDNPYSFILNDNPMSMLSVPGAKDCVIELNSLSKSHNMAGWRIGVLCGAKEKIDDVLRFKSNMDSGMFLPLQLAAAKALTLEKDWHDSINAIYKERREKVFELLDLLECSYAKEQAGMFVWAAIPANYKDGYELSDKVLYGSNVFITPGGIFGNAGDKYVRVSLCCTKENIEAAIKRIRN
jgi:aspartate/methionine/tyrosine aminotransferase